MILKQEVFFLEPCVVDIQNYGRGVLDIQLYTKETGEPMATASIRILGVGVSEIAVKDYSENEGMYDTLLKAGIIRPKHREVVTGWVIVPVCRLTDDVLQQLDLDMVRQISKLKSA